MLSALEPTALPLPASHIGDLRLASSYYLSGAERRAFQAAMTLKYCGGNARHAEQVFGWGRVAPYTEGRRSRLRASDTNLSLVAAPSGLGLT